MSLFLDGSVVIYTDEDLENIKSSYGLSSDMTVDDVAETLWFSSGIVLFDKRPYSEMLQVPAQSSFEFFSEEMTVSDLEELHNKRIVYHEVER